ncbi:FkbM family methyltransferase [Algoriphagus limi]|uniref:FkbM family methyltransferase n=1 Tax=Algoriphagus limi TaxID=2975273 RepID=A0ABT2G188_9BACT|nr:FkbM family methyltransferase [Algoriphagus limi]MCS5489028.1 FkbM family methyltransferase [Algoriphagus limi]
MSLFDKLSISLGYRFQNLSTKFKARSIFKRIGKKLMIRDGNSDIRVFKQIFIDEVYNFFPDQFEPKIIIDAGANVGYSPIWFKLMFPTSNVLAIEPEGKNFKILERNISGIPDIKALKNGLWYEETSLSISNPSSDSWGFRLNTTNSKGGNKIESITIPDLITKYSINQIDLLKIDIEGAEYELFKYKAETWLPYVRMIMLEVHDHIKEGCSSMIDGVVMSMGFSKFTSKELTIYIRND